MHFRCLCFCHDTEIDCHVNGVLTNDPLEAAVACGRCRNRHVSALLTPTPTPKVPEKAPWKPSWGDGPC